MPETPPEKLAQAASEEAQVEPLPESGILLPEAETIAALPSPLEGSVGSEGVGGGTPTSQRRDPSASSGQVMGHPTMEVAETGANGDIEEGKDEKNEETPVIEVHAPHEPIHTWKDFWIHLGTITVGLLIAISLEQSVEKLHQLHERHELEAALRTEAQHNKEVGEVNFAGYDEEMAWLQGIHEDIGVMLATRGKANLPVRVPHFHAQFANGEKFGTTGSVFETVVWDTADEDNRLVLLPDDEARAYSMQYHYVGARYLEMQLAIRDDLARQDAFEAQFGDIETPTRPVLSRMSPADLKQYDALVMQTFTAVRLAKGWLIALYASNEALRQGRFDSGSTPAEYIDASVRYKTDYKKMAQRVAADDAARDKAAGKP